MIYVFAGLVIWCAGWWLNVRLANGPTSDLAGKRLLYL